jgi:hypothetical protein
MGRIDLVDVIPKVTSEKPAIPTIWLDTSVVIKITKIAQGEVLQQIEIERLTRLRRLLEELVAAGKLLCPEADQEEEYVSGHLDKEIHSDFLVLSLGIGLQHRQRCFDYQAQLGMKAYVSQAETIDVPLHAYFHSDPVEELTAARKRSVVIGANLFKDTEILTGRRIAKTEVQKIWENLRQEFVAKRRTYAEQLEVEQRGYADALAYTVEEFEKKFRSGSIDFWDIMSAEGFLINQLCWKNLGGKPDGATGLHKFFCSSYFNNLPIARIHAQMVADLLTGNQAILSGDMMDVELLSVAVPVSHFVLTDKKMAVRIKRLGIDKDWNTEVFSMSEIDGLFERLEALR